MVLTYFRGLKLEDKSITWLIMAHGPVGYARLETWNKAERREWDVLPLIYQI